MGASKHVDPTTYSYARIDIKYRGDKKPNVKFSYPTKPVEASSTLFAFSAMLAVGLSVMTTLMIKQDLNFFETFGMLAAYLGWFWVWVNVFLKKKFPQLCVEFSQTICGNEHYKKVWTKVPKEKYLEIPYFDNLFMDYNAKGEFSKYLDKIKIEEHPFDCIAYKRKKEKKERNNTLWRCRFYFSKIPKTGNLEARWR